MLQVDAGKFTQIDPRNVESLFGMWTVFHKCAESIEQGKRLENMSWRLWNRETFCCESKSPVITPTLDIQPKLSKKDVPELSSSVSSVGSEPSSQRQPAEEDTSLSISRGKEKHITPERLEQLVISIKEKKVPEPLSPATVASVAALADDTPRPSSPTPTTAHISESPEPRSNHSSDSQYSSRTLSSTASDLEGNVPASDTSVASTVADEPPTIVHGFSPSISAISYKSKTNLSKANPTVHLESKCQNLAPPKIDSKKESKFIIGNGSVSEEESSFEDRLMLKPVRSSLSEGLHRSSQPQPPKKQASFREIVDARPMDYEDAIESDDDSVIDDEEDDSSWEETDNESQSSSVDDKSMFQRVDSRPNLTSRRSLLTSALTQGGRAEALQRAAMAAQSTPNMRRSRRSSPIGPSMPASPDDGSELTMRGPQATRAKPIIPTTSNTLPPAHSPRTNRRNMLQTELTQSLRHHLLWERQPRGGLSNAAFKRSHTTNNMANLRNKADKSTVGAEPSKNNSWNDYFDFGPSEYHAKGW